jgi:hypothetical protein
MAVDSLAQRLSSAEHIGLTAELRDKLGITTADLVRGRLMAQTDTDRSYLGVYLLAAYVVDDTDFWGDGEVYWWSIPTMVDGAGQATKNPLHGLPNGAPPHKVGSLEWMTNLSLKDPPLLAVIPPEERIAACVVRLGFYDDDGKPANVAAALTEGLEAYTALGKDAVASPDQIIQPVRQAIFTSLKAQEDDILVDQDITIRRGTSIPFTSGMIGSLMNSMIRLYYIVKDEDKTEQFGPVTLHKGQVETVKFSQLMRGTGRLTLFARGADVSCSAFGELNTATPFLNRVIDSNHEVALANGFTVTGTGPSKFVAFYTPPQ